MQSLSVAVTFCCDRLLWVSVDGASGGGAHRSHLVALLCQDASIAQSFDQSLANSAVEAVLALFVMDESVLMSHQITPPEPDRWDLPGSGVDPQESIEAARRREVQEETGIA